MVLSLYTLLVNAALVYYISFISHVLHRIFLLCLFIDRIARVDLMLNKKMDQTVRIGMLRLRVEDAAQVMHRFWLGNVAILFLSFFLSYLICIVLC